MGGSFSSTSSSAKKKAPGGTISQVDRAVLDLKNSRDRLQKYKTKLENDEQKILKKAKQAKDAGQTKTALGLLRLKKYKRTEVESVENQLLTVLQMVNTIDSKQNEQQMLGALKTGKDALSKLQQETSVDDVIELMDQIAEQNEVEKEVSQILQGVPSLSIEDEAQVEAELAALAAELAGETTPELPQAPTEKLPEPLPQAPTDKLPEVGKVAEGEKKVAVAS